MKWLLLAIPLLGCTQLDGSPPCYAPEILHYCEGLCTARSCVHFGFEERFVDLFVCGRERDYTKLRHRFLLQTLKLGYDVGDCTDPTCRPSIDGDGPVTPPPPYHEQGESEAAGAGTSGDWQPVPEGDCVP